MARYWVENQFFDFDDSLMKELFEFVEVQMPKDGLGDVAALLRKVGFSPRPFQHPVCRELSSRCRCSSLRLRRARRWTFPSRPPK
jgi:hypothetical protein